MTEVNASFFSPDNNKVVANVVRKDILINEIKNVLQFLAEVLGNSLGPYGQNTVIDGHTSMRHKITKDGKTILDSIVFEHPVARVIHEFIKTNAFTVVEKVGDGTTSSVLIAFSIYFKLLHILEKSNVPSITVLSSLNKIKDMIIEEIRTFKNEITQNDLDKIKKIATISSNNDEFIGNLITAIYSKIGINGIIHPVISFEKETTYEISNGFIHKRGYIVKELNNSPDGSTFTCGKCHVFMIDDFITKNDMVFMSKLMNIAESPDNNNNLIPLVILAKGFDEAIKNGLRARKKANPFSNICILDIAHNTEESNKLFDDLAAYIGAYPILRATMGEEMPNEVAISESKESTENSKKVFAKIASITIKKDITVFGKSIIKSENERITRRITEIEEEIKRLGMNEVNSFHINNMKARIYNLSNKMAQLYVGGENDTEIRAKKDLIDDAVLAVKSAINSGYCMGGNTTMIQATKNLCDNLSKFDKFTGDVLEMLVSAFQYPFSVVLKNAGFSDEKIANCLSEMIKTDSIYNLIAEKMEARDETSVINPIDTEIEILKGAISIVSLLLTSNQMTTEVYITSTINK